MDLDASTNASQTLDDQLDAARLERMVTSALTGTSVSREDALAVLRAPDEMTLQVVAAAGRVRRHFFGNEVLVNHLVNIKSGRCPENCNYCSQALGSTADILRYSWLPTDEIMAAVEAGVSQGASTICLVASGRQPSRREVEHVAGVIEQIKTEHPEVKLCSCLGFLDDEKAARLKQAGSDRYNHNLNTAEEMYPDICTTHTFADRANTVATVQRAGMSACSGLIAGMGETDEQLVDVVFSLREAGSDSVPVNFLLPFEGTPLESHRELTPQRCLRILSMVRLVNPDAEVRSAAGREYHIRSLQPLVLEVCNSIFLGDYLTSEGQLAGDDLQMITDAGFRIKGSITAEPALRVHAHAGSGGGCGGGGCGGGCGGASSCHDAATGTGGEVVGVPLRHRGVGARVPADAH